jgi:hypothetical protein
MLEVLGKEAFVNPECLYMQPLLQKQTTNNHVIIQTIVKMKWEGRKRKRKISQGDGDALYRDIDPTKGGVDWDEFLFGKFLV